MRKTPDLRPQPAASSAGRGHKLAVCTHREYDRRASQRCPPLSPCANGVWTLPTSPSPAPCGRPSTPPGTFRRSGWRLPSLPAGRSSLSAQARSALRGVIGRQAFTALAIKLLRGRAALHPLRGERQIPASSAEIGEGSSGQPSPTHPHAPVISRPAPSSCSMATLECEPNIPIQDHPTRRHRRHIQATTGHIPPKSGRIRRKTGHIRPETGHIRQKSGHIGSDGVDTCLSDGNASLRRFRVRR